ncbi:MAG: hypothetical protein K0S33_3927 [Bacteroidetes bacterium]|jgi:ferric-dicitrate binding protein FerR (iron transport regulator)|nr:hypothetical protein [Bacteroidota bacterium]
MADKKDILLAKYLSGNCSAEEKSILLKWQQEGKLSANELEMARQLWDAAEQLKKNENADTAAAWEQFVKQREQPFLHENKSRSRYPLLKIAAALLFLMAMGFTIRLLFFTAAEPVKEMAENKKTSRSAPEEISMIRIFSGDSISSFLLPDSSRILLNKHSALQYPQNYSTLQRITYLDGEAFFEVRHNDSLPFTVQCGTINTKVTGTSFGIKNRGNNKVEVSVATGTVEVSNIKNPTQKILLQQEEKVVFNSETASFSKGKSNSNDFKWKEKKQFGKKIKTFIQKLRKKI